MVPESGITSHLCRRKLHPVSLGSPTRHLSRHGRLEDLDPMKAGIICPCIVALEDRTANPGICTSPLLDSGQCESNHEEWGLP